MSNLKERSHVDTRFGVRVYNGTKGIVALLFNQRGKKMKFNFKNIKTRIKRSKDGKTVLANFGYLTLLQIAGYAFPLITMPYLARVIGADGFGNIAFAAAIIVWVQTIADWGFNFSATRDVAQNKGDKEKVSEIFSNVLWARCLLAVVAGCILAAVTCFIPYFKKNALIIFVTYLMVPGHILFPEWFFQAIEKMKYTTIFNLLLKLIFTVAVFIFIKDKDDYVIQPLLTTVGYLACGIVAMYLITIRWGYSISKPKWQDIYRAIKGSCDVFINNLMPNLYNSFSIMLLGIWGGPAANGVFDGGNKFPMILRNSLHVLSRAFYPFLSRRSDKHGLYTKLNLSLSVIGSVLLILLAPWIIHIMLGDEFAGSVVVMRIMSLSVIAMSVNNTYGTNFLILHHQERSLRRYTTVLSLIGMVAGIPLVYIFHEVGAALVILLCRIMLGGSAYFLAIKYKKNHPE